MVWWYLRRDSPGERGGAPHGFEFSGAAFGRLFTLQALSKLHEKTSREKGIFGRRQRSPYQASMDSRSRSPLSGGGVNGSFANPRRRAA